MAKDTVYAVNIMNTKYTSINTANYVSCGEIRCITALSLQEKYGQNSKLHCQWLFYISEESENPLGHVFMIYLMTLLVAKVI